MPASIAIFRIHDEDPVLSRHTDTLLISLTSRPVTESRDLNEDTLLDLDTDGNIVAITVEHARSRADLEHFAFEQRETPGHGLRIFSIISPAPLAIAAAPPIERSARSGLARRGKHAACALPRRS